MHIDLHAQRVWRDGAPVHLTPTEFALLARLVRQAGQVVTHRQLLRDVSHELRSPLARLRVALALAERAGPAEREQLWGRLTQECDRLEALIGEILAPAIKRFRDKNREKRASREAGRPHE